MTEPTRLLDKVTGFVTRPGPAGPELLVFRHPKAGVQVPAGTVEPGEPLEAAVRREVREEGGLADLALVGLLASFPEVPPPGWRAFLRRTWARAEPGGAARVPLWCRRGIWVEVLEERDGWARVRQDERTAWVRADALTDQLRRHLFHLEATGPTPERWTTRTDRHRFSLFWVPLAEDPGLIRSQAAWLARVRERLLAGRR